MNTNHGKLVVGKGRLFMRFAKLKQPRKTASYSENMALELCYQYPVELKYYDKLMKYFHRAGGRVK